MRGGFALPPHKETRPSSVRFADSFSLGRSQSAKIFEPFGALFLIYFRLHRRYKGERRSSLCRLNRTWKNSYMPTLLRYCTGLLGCEADAQDAVQKTFIKAWQQRRTLRGDGTDNECAWLYRIAYRTALDMLRAARRAANYPTPEPREQDPGISDELRTALAALPPLDRALVLERVLDGLDYAALARIHGRPAAYLRTRYHRAKKQLASRLREGEHHDE